ncbi:MAG: hypothetical protein J6K13_02105 [Clostridia bacterium]|nr:hypothetical protein [Clostridia bacterium]
MKKLAAVILALLLCLGTALADSADVVGVWYLDEIITDGVVLNPSLFEMDMTLELLTDGTARRMTQTADETGTWAMNGQSVVFSLAGSTETFTLENGKLTGCRDNMEIVLVKERFAPSMPEIRQDAVLADFNGAWYATLVESMGMRFPVADMGMSMVITLANGTAIIDEGVEEQTAVSSGTAAMNGSTLVIALPDGSTIPLQLHATGEVSYTAEDTVIFFERVQ